MPPGPLTPSLSGIVSELTARPGDAPAMRRTIRRDLIRSGLHAAGLLFAAPASAERERDHDRARRAVEQGEALPLSTILAHLGPDLGGEVVGVSFEEEAGSWAYEFMVIGPTGHLMDVLVDARSARVIGREEH